MKHTDVKYHPQKKIPTVLLENYKLQDITALASGDYFVETDNGYYSVDTINGALQLHKARRKLCECHLT